MRRDLKRSLVAVAGVAAIALVAEHPTADIRLITHDRTDPAPRVVQAAVDVGLFGVSVLYTWTVDRLR
jgi:hypothetical protein